MKIHFFFQKTELGSLELEKCFGKSILQVPDTGTRVLDNTIMVGFRTFRGVRKKCLKRGVLRAAHPRTTFQSECHPPGRKEGERREKTPERNIKKLQKKDVEAGGGGGGKKDAKEETTKSKCGKEEYEGIRYEGFN